MPVSEHEELGVNLSRHTSDSVAGVPIKKRRFPLISSPSPPPRRHSLLKGEPDLPNTEKIQSLSPPSQILTSLKGEPDLPKKEQSITKPESLSFNAGGERDASAVSVITQGSSSEDKGECFADQSAISVKSSENLIGFNLQESMLPRTTGALDKISTDRVVSENTELLLASKETFGLSREGKNAERSGPDQENFDSYSQALGESCTSNHHGMAKDPCSAEGQNNVQNRGSSKSKVVCSRLCANRSHWDLNTMMDTWEGSLSDAAINHGASGTDGLCPNGICDKKVVVCSVGVVSREPEHTSAPLEKHVLEGRENCFKLSISCASLDEPINSKSFLNQGPTFMSTELSLMKGASDLSLPEKLRSPAGSLKSDDGKILKSESFEVGSQEESKTVKLANPKSLDCRVVKFEPLEGRGHEVLKIECKAVKSEPFEGSAQQDLQKTVEGTSCHLEFFSTHDIPISGEIHPIECGVVGKASDLVSESVVPDGVESAAVTDRLLEAVEMTCMDGANPKPSKSILMDELCADPYDNNEAVESDEEEKINLSADLGEEDAYGSDYDSDGCRNAVGVMDTLVKQQEDEDDYEDGEVREELLVHSVIEAMCEEEVEHVDYGDSDNKEGDDCNVPVDDRVVMSSHVEGRNSRAENSVETKNPYCIGEHVSNEKNCQGLSAVPSLQELSACKLPNVRSEKQRPIKADGRLPQDHSKGTEKELASDPAVSVSQETFSKDSQSDAVNQWENAKGSKLGEESHLIFPKTEASVNGDETNKDVNGRDSQSRIINLVRAPNGSPPRRTRSIPGRPLSLRTERERSTTDLLVRGDKLRPRVSRGESGMDDFRKFEREWNLDQPPKNYGPDFMHVRGRADNRMDTSRAIWDSDRDYASEHHNGSPSFRFPRAKNAAAIAAAKLECSGFVVAPDGTIVGANRAGRKPVNDEMQSFRHPPSRRRSPGGRDGPMPSPGVQMVRRPVRDISPDLVQRHEEKFMRGLPDDTMDPFFSHPQPQYERVDNNPFGRRERINRKFSPIQRRGSIHFPRVRSKSPPRSTTRSPRPWSSPRRSPGGFNGRPEQMRGRSPPIFRVERMRSAHHPCFQENMMGRRHGSPPFILRIPDGMREMDSPRERDHPRPFISNRSPSGRILRRDPKRFDLTDGRERTDSDEYFGPLHSGQFRELSGNRIVDERRKFSGRRGPVRSFRPYDIGASHFHMEDDSRPYFSPEADEEFPVRGGSRDFEGRIKNRPGNTLRRPRSMERQEDNYRFGGQRWSDAGFNDVRLKRRKF